MPTNSPAPDFTFDLHARRTRIPLDTLVAAIKAFAASAGHRRFRVADFQRWPKRPASAGTIIRRFGSWRNALALAGIPDVQGRRYPPEELIERLERAWRSLGRPPGRHAIKRLVNITAKPYVRHWGSLTAACEQLTRYHAGRITRKALLRPLAAPRPAIRPSIRFAVLRRDNHTCQTCGRAAPDVKLELDHIIPVRDGGQDTLDNLRALCRECNRGKA